jgi:WD40 repeat protein
LLVLHAPSAPAGEPAQPARILSFYRWPVAPGAEPALALAFESEPHAFALSDDRRRLVVDYRASPDIELLELREHRLLWSAADLEHSAAALDLAPDGSEVAVGGVRRDSLTGRLYLVSAADPSQRLISDDFDNNIDDVRYSPQGDAVAVSAYDGRIRLFTRDWPKRVVAASKVLRHERRANVYKIAFSADGSKLMSASGDQTLRLWGSP